MRRVLIPLIAYLCFAVPGFAQTSVPLSGSCIVTYNANNSANVVCTSTAVVPPAPAGSSVVSVAIFPTTPSVQAGTTQQFSATVTVTGGASQAVTWSASAGTISSTGLFTAPSATGPVTITATSVADTTKSASTVATVTSGSVSSVVSVTISPSAPTVQTSTTQQFSATVTVTGGASQAVTWSASAGTISSAGLFTAPSTAGSVTVTATSVADTTKSASVTATVVTSAGSGMQQYATDNFARANGALGPSWSPLVGEYGFQPLTIVNQQVQGTATGYAKMLYYGGINWPADQYSQAQAIAIAGGRGGPAVRMSSNGQHYVTYVSSLGTGNASVSLVLDSGNNSYTTLAMLTSATIQANDYIQLAVQGTSLTVTDITTSTILLTATDATVPVGYPGLIINDSGALTNQIWANWSAGAATKPLSLMQLASDNFNRANAPNLGPNWTVGVGGWDTIHIVNQQIEPNGGFSKEHYTAVAFLSDQWSQGQIIATNGYTNGPELRYQSNIDTHYVFNVFRTGAPGICSTGLVRNINGTYTTLLNDSAYCAVALNDYVRVQAQGSLISVIDATTGVMLMAVIDTQITGGYPGWSFNAGASTPIAANWSGGGFQ